MCTKAKGLPLINVIQNIIETKKKLSTVEHEMSAGCNGRVAVKVKLFAFFKLYTCIPCTSTIIAVSGLFHTY